MMTPRKVLSCSAAAPGTSTMKSGAMAMLRRISCRGLTLAAAAMLLASCVRTGVEDGCEFPIRLRFSYVYNREGRDLLREEVPNLSLYLFDLDTRELVKSSEFPVSDLPEDAALTLNAPPGRYCLVTWGGAGDRYMTADAADLAAHDCTIFADENGDVEHRRQHLWHAITDGILVNGSLTPVHDVELIKLSNDITVSVRSADGSALTKDASKAEITAGNGRHDYSGAIHREPMQVRYVPASDDSKGHVAHEFTTLSLHDNDNSWLQVDYGDTDLYSGSLTALIARQPDIDFGLDDEFFIDFSVAPDADGAASVSVSVNGWRVDQFEVTLK